jgi:hypothetical protein
MDEFGAVKGLFSNDSTSFLRGGEEDTQGYY